MKKTILLTALVLLSIVSCQKSDDSPTVPEIELQKEPPLSFDLLAVQDNTEDVELSPTLSWESAENPAGNEVTYDLYFGTDLDPSNLIQGNLSETAFEMGEDLEHLTTYYWKVIATDTEGQTSQSPIGNFTTRNYRITDEALNNDIFLGARWSHASAVFNDRVWITGGFTDTINEDVISTSNGLEFTIYHQSEGFSGFGERSFHEMLVFDNRLWVLGGRTLNGPSAVKEDVWQSEDGLVWTEAIANAAFGAKSSFGATVFDDKMWVIGGNDENFDRTNDVWYSEDGSLWVPATHSADFSKRIGHAVVTFQDKLWVIGGFDGSERKNDVWYSEDGISWTEATAEANFQGRNSHKVTVFDDKMWVIGGTVENFVRTNDVWYSEDGIHWIEADVPDAFSSRSQHTSVTFMDSIWILAGSDFIGAHSDIWVLE